MKNDWNRESLERRGKPVAFLAQHAHRAAVKKAVAEKEARRQEQRCRLDAVATIIYDLSNKLKEANELLEKGLL